MWYFEPLYLLFMAPAVLLALWAQMKVHSSFAAAQRVPARLSGAQAAREILDRAGLFDVAIEPTHGFLSDHYDPRHKVLRLSPHVFQEHTAAAVGVAAHEAGHALQDAERYAPLVVRNAAVPVANFGSGVGILLLILGVALAISELAWVGLFLFGGVVFFQLVNLPVEFNASTRAKQQLATLGIVGSQEMPYVERVLSAAALTYVAATLQSLLMLLYFALRVAGSSRD
jgi:Zn-dependent membrane protease YugP